MPIPCRHAAARSDVIGVDQRFSNNLLGGEGHSVPHTAYFTWAFYLFSAASVSE